MPPKHATQLIESVLSGKMDDALYQTCVLLMSQKVEALEDAWISIAARLGDGDAASAATWYAVCKEIASACFAEGFHVKDALVLTAKLCLLARGSTYRPSRNLNDSLSRLRTQVIEYFPERGARLTMRGVECFSRILPSNEEERMFAERVLVGISQLWEERKVSELRAAMEYLIRKRQLCLHAPSEDIYPNMDERDVGDMVWFLWGAYICRYPWLNTLWSVYAHRYKKSVRLERIGLLLGCRSLLHNMGEPQAMWGEADNAAFAYIRDHAVAMWKEAAGGKDEDEDEEDVDMGGRADIWELVPRAQAARDYGTSQATQATQEVRPIRVSNLEKSRGRHRYEEEQPDDAEVDAELSDIDSPRNRRQHSGQGGARETAALQGRHHRQPLDEYFTPLAPANDPVAERQHLDAGAQSGDRRAAQHPAARTGYSGFPWNRRHM